MRSTRSELLASLAPEEAALARPPPLICARATARAAQRQKSLWDPPHDAAPPTAAAHSTASSLAHAHVGMPCRQANVRTDDGIELLRQSEGDAAAFRHSLYTPGAMHSCL